MNVILALCQDSMIYQFKITATNSLEEKYRVMEFLNRLSALKYIRGKVKANILSWILNVQFLRNILIDYNEKILAIFETNEIVEENLKNLNLAKHVKLVLA